MCQTIVIQVDRKQATTWVMFPILPIERKAKPIASLHSQLTPKRTQKELKVENKQSETYDKSKNAKNTSQVTIDDASSTVRHSKMNGVNFRTIQEQNSSSLRESDILQNNNVSNPTETSDDMKVYRGPFSVSWSTTKEPSVVLNDMVRALDRFSVSFQRLGKYFIKCQK